MPNESQNKLPFWKDKLDALDGLADETFDKAGAWEKLHTRLHVKSSRKKITWYWAAAACLLLGLLIVSLPKTRKEISLVKHPLPQKPSIVKPATPQTTIKNNTEVVTSFQVHKKPVKSFANKPVKTISPANINITTDTSLATNSDTASNTLNNIISTNTPVAKVQPRQKFRVIHINELSHPVEEVRFARNEGSIFPIKISNKDVFSGPSTSNNYSSGILKINLSPQN